MTMATVHCVISTEKKHYNPNWHIEALNILIYLFVYILRTIDNDQMEEKSPAINNALKWTIAISSFQWAMRLV